MEQRGLCETTQQRAIFVDTGILQGLGTLGGTTVPFTRTTATPTAYHPPSIHPHTRLLIVADDITRYHGTPGRIVVTPAFIGVAW